MEPMRLCITPKLILLVGILGNQSTDKRNVLPDRNEISCDCTRRCKELLFNLIEEFRTYPAMFERYVGEWEVEGNYMKNKRVGVDLAFGSEFGNFLRQYSQMK